VKDSSTARMRIKWSLLRTEFFEEGRVVLEIDPAKLDCEIVDENLEGGKELFPHIYGRLEMSAVVRVYPLPCDPGGEFTFALSQ